MTRLPWAFAGPLSSKSRVYSVQGQPSRKSSLSHSTDSMRGHSGVSCVCNLSWVTVQGVGTPPPGHFRQKIYSSLQYPPYFLLPPGLHSVLCSSGPWLGPAETTSQLSCTAVQPRQKEQAQGSAFVVCYHCYWFSASLPFLTFLKSSILDI